MHYDMRFANPLDEEVLHRVMKKFQKIITVEDGVIKGGFGTAVLEFAADHGYTVDIKRMGIPDYFVEHGTQQELWHECGYDAEGIRSAILNAVGNRQPTVGSQKQPAVRGPGVKSPIKYVGERRRQIAGEVRDV